MCIYSEFSSELDKLRRAAGLSVTELADRAKTSQPYVSNVINGKICPSLKQAEKLAAAVGAKVKLQLTRPRTKLAG